LKRIVSMLTRLIPRKPSGASQAIECEYGEHSNGEA
jgi:hypothetical protein